MQNLAILEFESYIDGSLSIFVEHLEEITPAIRSEHSQAIEGIIDCTVMQASVTVSFLVEEIAFVANQDFKDFWEIETNGGEESSISMAVLELQQAALVHSIIIKRLAMLAKIGHKMDVIV